jgi:hypothetical protein
MLADVLPLFAGRRVVLASASPRRHEILAKTSLAFDVVVSGFAEDCDWRGYASPVRPAVAMPLPPPPPLRLLRDAPGTLRASQ